MLRLSSATMAVTQQVPTSDHGGFRFVDTVQEIPLSESRRAMAGIGAAHAYASPFRRRQSLLLYRGGNEVFSTSLLTMIMVGCGANRRLPSPFPHRL
jgi:hypothetical protein